MKTIIRFLVVSSFILTQISIAQSVQTSGHGGGDIKITILYDNTVFNQATISDWGFSCLVEGLEKTILFDAGASGTILLLNASALGVSLKNANLIVLSHDHSDHTAGLLSALGSGSTASVFFGNSFVTAWDPMITATGATVNRSATPVNLLPSVRTTGEVEGSVYEQALIISADSGLVVVMGCSHPGVIQILERAKQLLSRNIYMVIGGFHWLGFTDSQVNTLIRQMKDMGVRKCGATHCTGDQAIALVKQSFGSDFVDMGVGRVITLSSTVVNVNQEIGSRLTIPHAFALYQSYPNPFNPTTMISYELPVASQVRMSLFDLLGREVAVLVNEKLSAGTHRAKWDAGNAPSGVYFYRLTAGSFSATKKLILMR